MKKAFVLSLCIFVASFLHAQSYFDSTWTEYFRLNSGGWTAGDATISVPLPDGRVIWLFGDSYTVPVNPDNTLPCLFQVRNCMMVQDSVDRSHFITILDTTQTGVNQTTFKLIPNDTTIFWPGAGYARNDTVNIFLERYSSTVLGEYYGVYMVKLALPGLEQLGISEAPNTGQDIYGRAVVADEENGYLYIYGNSLNWIVWEPVVARCNINNPLTGWRFWDGTGWTIFPGQAVKISDEPVSPGFSVFPYQGKYYLITQENGYLECGLGREIYSMESDFPWGPFVNKKLLYIEESTFNGNYLLTYNAQAHPWEMENNELLICYNVNDRVDLSSPNICPSQCQNIFTDRMDADTYRPKFIRVPMDMIVSADDHQEQAQKLLILPNPVKRGEKISIPSLKENENIQISIYDISGRKVIEEKLRQNGELKAPEVPGIYLITFDGGGLGVIVVQ